MANVKTAPGQLRMACRIWEPQPVKARKQQEESFVYNMNTIGFFRHAAQNVAGFEDSIYLRERYVFYDTFLTIAGKPLNTDRTDFLDFKGNPLFKNGKPTNNWQYHQNFILNGSLYTNDVFDPTSTTVTPGGTDGLSQWVYNAERVPQDGPGRDGRTGKDDFDTTGSSNPRYSEWRKVHRFSPMQVAGPAFLDASISAQQDPKADPSTLPTNKPVHWLALKDTSMYNGQDFFVQFKKGSFYHNTASTTKPMKYPSLDAGSDAHQEVNGATIYNNMGMISLGPDGKPNLNAKETINLAKQPYYCIEINHGDDIQNFWIIIPFNSYPIFIHRGKYFPILVPGDETVPPVLVMPKEIVSRRLSTYDVSSRELMQQDYLTVTVRNHNGKMIVTFSGHEENPWVIDRYDYDIDEYDKDKTKFVQFAYNVRVRPFPIQIGAGNALCGFKFGTLQYEESAYIDQPETVTVKGPVTENDLNLLLAEKEQTTNNGKPFRPFVQDAEVYMEVINGKSVLTRKVDTIQGDDDSWRIKGIAQIGSLSPLPRPYIKTPMLVPTDSMGKISYIRVQHTSFKPISTDSDVPESLITKECHVRYTLGAGDMTVYPDDKDRIWTIPNCVTPIANGWRLYVPPSGASHSVCPVEVAQHVINFTASSSYTDNHKIEHSGSIKFIMNFGTMTGAQYTNNSTDAGDSNSFTGCVQPPPGDEESYKIDQTKILSNLSGKTFFIRVYAWWDGGFMDCANSSCNCGTRNVVGDPRVVFTGLCHGGQITVENGKRYMDCQLLDYWKILEDNKFLNSPFFDGMRDFNAVQEILKLAGFSEDIDTESSRKPDPYPPARFNKKCADENKAFFSVQSAGGEWWFQSDYALPSAYDILQNPIMKFADQSGYDEAISTIAQKSGKIVYFDRYGEFLCYSETVDRNWMLEI
jgi:hypothetical protein